MEKEYLLKHKEIPVLFFKMDDETYELSEVKEILDEKRLPFGLKDKGNKTQCGIKLNNWIRGRGLADSRRDINKIKNIFKVKEKEELIVKSYGLNLTDHYWIHKEEENLKWEKLNFFENKFDKIKVGGIANPDIDESVDKKSPNFCVDGSIEKRWIIKGSKRLLLKGSRYIRMQEPFNELIASEILDLYGIEHVKYALKRTEGKNIPYSECNCMVDEKIEYINAQCVMESEEYSRKDPYKHYLDICKKNGLANSKKKIDEMIAIDFIIGNEDRHRGNFGILRNADTLEWLKTAPVFDNGNCLFFDRENEDELNWGIDSLGKAFGDSNRLCLNNINYPEWYHSNLNRKVIDIIYNVLKDNERLKEDRIEKIVGIANERFKVFEKVISEKRS